MKRIMRVRWLASMLLAVALVGIFQPASARADIGSSFSYYNPRTGRGYSSSWYLGRGSYYQSYSYGTPYRYYGYNYRQGPPRGYGYRYR